MCTDSHGAVTASREGSDETLVGVGVFTVLRSTAHHLQASLGTGLRHHPFRQPVTAIGKLSYRKPPLFYGLIHYPSFLVNKEASYFSDNWVSIWTVYGLD